MNSSRPGVPEEGKPLSAQEAFLYSISHDLKGPLHTILGFAEVMQNDLAAGQTASLASDLGRIQEAAQDMQSRLDALLKLSRLGRDAHVVEVISLSVLAEEAALKLQPRIQATAASLQIDPGLASREVFRVPVVDLFIHLLDNAIKFARPGSPPRIEVGAEQEGAQTVYFVRDYGRGLESRDLERIFGMFRKLDGTSKGCGAGLALARRIVELHQGRIWAESSGLGTGCVLRFVLAQPKR